jgi:RNA polymerase primary sigma factor
VAQLAQCARLDLAHALARDPELDAELLERLRLLAVEAEAAHDDVPHARLELVDDPVSLDVPVGDGESLYGDLIEDMNSAQPEEKTAHVLRAKELAAALANLNPRMRHVLALRFGLDGEKPQTLEEVGNGLGITRERVRQLESRALRELRLAAPDLELYLRP